jgi:glycosyltransferase involved in cell wall biosynthesis
MFDIVMPLYNKEQFVAESIESVLRQSFPDWRLFIVDDGSVDRSAAIAAKYTNPKISLIRQSNQGVGPARNAGIRAGAAPWVAFLDSDDVWDADHLAELDALRSEFPDAVLIGCGFRRFSGSRGPKGSSSGAGNRRLAGYFAECARVGGLFMTSSSAGSRAAIDTVGGFKPLPGNEDVELWARLALHGPVAVSSRCTVNYRTETGGITDAGMGGRKPKPKPTRREDLSATIPTLEAALPQVSDPALREDIIAYMDSRIGIRLVAAVLDGDIDYARRLLPLYRGKPIGKARAAAAIARLPAPLGKSIVATRSLIKRAMVRR